MAGSKFIKRRDQQMKELQWWTISVPSSSVHKDVKAIPFTKPEKIHNPQGNAVDSFFCFFSAFFVATSLLREVATMSSGVYVREWSNLRIVFGKCIGSTSGYRFYTISDSTKRYYVDDNRGQYRHHPILFRPLSSTIDYLSTETFQFHVK